MTRYVYRDGELYEAHKAPPRLRGPRSALPSPYIRPDGMGDMRSMADGLLYDSKSAYYKSVKDAGCEIVGDDKAWTEPPSAPAEPSIEGVERDVAQAIQSLGG